MSSKDKTSQDVLLKEAATLSRLKEAEALLAAQLKEAREQHEKKMAEMDAREAAACSRLEEVEMLIETLAEGTHRAQMQAIETEISSQKDMLLSLVERTEAARKKIADAEVTSTELLSTAKARKQVLEREIEKAEQRVAELGSAEKRAKSQPVVPAVSAEGATDDPHLILARCEALPSEAHAELSRLPVSPQKELTYGLRGLALLQKLDSLGLIDDPPLIQRLAAARTQLAEWLAGLHLYEFAITPGSDLTGLESRVKIASKLPGDGPVVVLDTLKSGFVYEPVDQPALCLSPALILLGPAPSAQIHRD